MKRNFIVCIALFLCTVTLSAQKEYKIEEFTVVNLGDGRLLHRDAKTEEPLNGERRLIDGYRSEYILANFKDGLYDGPYKHFKRDLLALEGNYKGGLKEGVFKTYYGDGKTVQSESSFAGDKLHGVAKQYDQQGRIEQENHFQEGVAHGSHRAYRTETGEIRSDENYVKGKLEGKQVRKYTGSKPYTEITYYKDGLQEGTYEKELANGIKTETGSYSKGKKSGPWVKLNADGDSLEIKTYQNGELEGLSVDYFTTGKRSKAYMYKKGKRDGQCIDYDNRTGNPKKIAHYKENREHGTVKTWMTSSGFDFIETVEWENGKRNGTYKAVYREDKQRGVKEGVLKETGQYKNGNKVGIWKYYDTEGKLTRENDMDK